jgi:hypothetical protein
MIINKSKPARIILDWLDSKKFNYDIDIFRSNPLHGQYYIKFENKRDEFMARMHWGIV